MPKKIDLERHVQNIKEKEGMMPPACGRSCLWPDCACEGIPDPRTTELRATVARLEAENGRLREALKPFVNLLNSFEDRYLRRGGDPHGFPDTHPSFDITAYDLRIGCWRAARAALDPQP